MRSAQSGAATGTAAHGAESTAGEQFERLLAVMDRLRAGLAEKPMTMRDYFGDSLGTEHYYRHPRSYARRGVFSIDEPSPTITSAVRVIFASRTFSRMSASV